MDNGLPVIETDRLTLRPYSLADAGCVQQMCNDWDVASTTLALPYPYPDGAAEEWISAHAESFRQGNEIILAITLKPGGQVIGSVGLTVNKNHQRGELGYMIAKAHWNHGYCTEACRALMGYGFRALGLNRIQAMHFPRNPASGRVMQKLGMTREGLLRQYARGHERFEDVVTYSMLRTESNQTESTR